MRSILKSSFRQIKRTWNRYVALVAIVALGVAFLSGLKAAGPNMALMGNSYFSDHRFMDASILSTVGFNNRDADTVRALDGVEEVRAIRWVDALRNNDEQQVLRVTALPDEGAINSLWLRAGRMPQADNECVVDYRTNGKQIQIGDTVIVGSGTDDPLTESLTRLNYTVVGIASAPDYLTFDRGSSRVGNGTVSDVVWVREDCFKTDYYTQLVLTYNGTAGLDAFGSEYQALSDRMEAPLADLADTRAAARGQEIRNEANDTLDEKQAEYEDAKAEAQGKIDDAQMKIDDAQQELDDGKRKLADERKKAEKKFDEAQGKLDAGARQLSAGRKEYNKNLKAYEDAVAEAEPQFAAAQQQIDATLAQIAAMQEQLTQLQQQLEQGKAAGVLTDEQIATLEGQIAQLTAGIAQAQAGVEDAQNQLATQKKALDDAEAQLDAAKAQLDSAAYQLQKGKEELADARAKADKEFAKAQKKIDDGEQELADAQVELSEARAEADEKLADAAAKIGDARQDIADLPEPKWIVSARADNAGYADYDGAIDRLNGLAKVFPVFFFLVAALVCLTTMTRMVDKNRGQIGMLKAMGYGGGAIAFQFVFYALTAGLLGGALGLAVGFTFLPYVIIHSYQILYTLPGPLMVFHTDYAALSVGVAVGVTLVATLYTCWQELLSTPATLLRPRTPKAGRRVFLEQIGPLWRWLRFSQKVAIRNLLRYRGRFYMTVVGVACCTALLLVGFGLKDSIGTQVADRQFGEILTYDLNVAMPDGLTADERAAVAQGITDAGVASALPVHWETVDLNEGGATKSCTLIVPRDPAALSDYIHLRQVDGGVDIALGDGLVVTQKLAELMDLQVGDTVTLSEGELDSAEVRVAAIAENYLMHYAFLSPEVYAQTFGEDTYDNQFLGRFGQELSDGEQAALSARLLEVEDVSGVHLTADTIRSMNDILKTIDLIIVVIVGAAAVLAFVVLYTLTSINISERYRELATIKVLGFFDREVGAYVFRESYALTFLGALAGCVLALPLHAFVLQAAEVDIMVYVQQILPRSFVFSVAMTMVFTWIVNLMALGRLRHIDMVEALKSAE